MEVVLKFEHGLIIIDILLIKLIDEILDKFDNIFKSKRMTYHCFIQSELYQKSYEGLFYTHRVRNINKNFLYEFLFIVLYNFFK